MSPINSNKYCRSLQANQQYTVPTSDDSAGGSYKCQVTVDSDASLESEAFNLAAVQGT